MKGRGCVFFFHGSMAHGSRSNYSQERMRSSFIFHYVLQNRVEISRVLICRCLGPNGEEVVEKGVEKGGVYGDG